MCTISYIPDPRFKDRFFVTDNRDESVNRPAVKPKVYQELNTALYYPKDTRRGGTWFGVSERKRSICLMNGAFSKYERRPPYRKSRGVVVKELLASEDLLKKIELYDFEGIEPFFALLFLWDLKRRVLELVWDGQKVYLNEKDDDKPRMWSSAMSYSKEEHEIKEKRFSALLQENRRITPELLWTFHHHKEEDFEGGFAINRGAFRTTSISQLQLHSGESQSFRFHDLLSDEITKEEIEWQ